MSQPRTAGGVVACFDLQHVLTAIKIFLTANWFRRRPVSSAQRWQPRWLVYVALMVMWDDAATLGERFDAARSTLAQWFIGRRRPGYSYQLKLTGVASRTVKQSADFADFADS